MAGFWSSGPVLVAGPCALERDEVNLTIAEALAALGERLALKVVYKGSFDKANRARPGSPRGLGLERGLAALDTVRSQTGLAVLTDVHESAQVPAVAAAVDALQIPALLSRQTDLLIAAAKSGKAINIKKGQSMAAADMAGAVEKVRSGGGADIAVTERGTFFGYGDLVVDMRNFSRIRAEACVPDMFDATHAVQHPGRAPDGSSGGGREFVPALLLAAAAAGADGFFLEVHPDPWSAPSDRATMWPLERLEPLIERALEVRARGKGPVHA